MVAALCCTPLVLIETGLCLEERVLGGVGWLNLRATLGMVMAMALWGRSIHRLGPKQTMIYLYLEPVSAVLIAAAVLGEALHPLQAVGALLTFLGVALASSH